MAEKLPFFALSAVASFVTFVTQQRGGAVMAIEKLPLGERTGNALISYCRYLEKLFWPTDLAVFYPYPEHWPVAQVFLAGGLLLGVSVWALMLRRRFPYLLTGWLWFVGTLVPVIGLVQVGEQAMADRYTYLPSLGMLVLAIWGAGELAGRGRYAVRTLALAGCAAVVLCLALTRHQLESWWNSETLFRHALAVTENNGTAHSNLGFALVKDGRTDEAIHHFQEALRINPKEAGAYNNLGNALIGQGQLDEGIQSYQQALRLTPEDAQIHNSLGSAYVKQGNLDAAIQHFQQGLRFTPNDAEIHNHLGDALARKGRLDAAIDQFREALRLKPDDPTAHYNLAIALGKQGNLNVAIEQFQAALLVQPDYPAARSNLAIALAQKSRFDNSIRGEAPRSQPDDREARHKLGMALVNQGRMDEAIREFQAALRLRPNDAAAHKNLGLALAMKGQIDEAINHFQDATRLNPDDPETLYNLGLALEKRGRIDEAIGQYQQVLRLKPEYADACNNLGYLWAERGENLDQARALIEKAVQVQPQNAGFLDSLAWVLLKQKRPREALGYGLKAVEKSAQPDAGIYDHLGDIYAALNQREQAAGAWRKSLAAAPNPQVQKKVGELSPH